MAKRNWTQELMGATIAAVGMFLGMQGGTTAVTVLFQSYFNNVDISGVVQVFAMIPIVAFTPLARKMVTKYGKKELATVGSIASMIACVLMLVLPITPNAAGIGVYMVCQLLNSLGLGIYSTVGWAMMGDAIIIMNGKQVLVKRVLFMHCIHSSVN